MKGDNTTFRKEYDAKESVCKEMMIIIKMKVRLMIVLEGMHLLINYCIILK